MFSFIPLPYRVVALFVAVMAFASGMFYLGHRQASLVYAAQRSKEQAEYQKAYEKQVSLSNELSGKLAKAEGAIVTKTVEVIKYVDKVTDGHKCLDASAVGLLQPGSNQTEGAPASKPSAEGSSPSASDRDVYLWIAGANQQYETCAVRLNSLIDFELNKE